jgi:nicotinamidase-related amidase
MPTVRPGHRAALLIVDVQVGVVQTAWEAPRVIANLALTVDKARAESVPVIWVQHADDDLPYGSPGWAWVPELVPAAGETLIHKRHNSAFEGTPLEPLLAELGVSHLVLGGASSPWCIRATAYAALERGYDLTLLADAHTNHGATLEGGCRLAATDIADELNLTMTWLSYPGRRNTAIKVDALSFGAAP